MNNAVLITGASSGIGLELSKIFARKGYNIVMISQNERNLVKAKNIVHKENPDIKILAITKDLSNPLTPEEIFEYAKQNSVQVDILVNNAGVQVYGNFHEASMVNTIDMMYLNMIALTKLTRLFVNEMISRGNGKILNIGSTGSFQSVPLNSVYCASKAYVLYFSEGIREELDGTGVSVTTLCPGATRTNFAKRADIEDIKLFSGKLLSPSYVAMIGYNALMENKSVVIIGLYNKFMVMLTRLMPRRIVTRIGMKLMKKK